MATLPAVPHLHREIDFQILSDSNPLHPGPLSIIP
jgi:hypothetical protein